MASVGVAWNQCVYHGLSGCLWHQVMWYGIGRCDISRVGVGWPKECVSMSQLVWDFLSGCVMLLVCLAFR